jgi:Calcium/calmodulin dependent protein kinase II association domain
MRKLRSSPLLIVLLTACASTPTRPAIDAELDVSGKILTRLQAVAERFYNKDPLAYTELLAENVTYFAPITPGRVEGIEAVRALFVPFQGKLSVPRFEILNPKLQLHGDIGIFTYNLNEYGTDGAVATRWNSTEVYRRFGDKWQAVHAHWSQIPKSQ